jgi:hypothetical protein
MAVDLAAYAKTHTLSEFEAQWCTVHSVDFQSMTQKNHTDAGNAYTAYRSTTTNTQTSTPRGNITTDPLATLNASANVKSGLSEKTETYRKPNELLSVSNMGDEILKQIERESQLHTDINEKMGITGELSRAYRDSIIETVPNALRLGFDIKNLTELTTKLAETSGRFNLISQDTMEKTIVTTRAFGTTMMEMGYTMSEFEKIGLGQSDTLAKINKAGRDSLSVGLNSKTVLKDIQTNLGKLNEYGFKNGVEGLTRMSQKATEFRMSMSEAFKLADKVMDPSDAIALTANMQMLGGAIGDLNDPLKLMYMATNDVEGLQDALHGASAGLATYNQEQGRFEITGANLRRAKEMAKTLGVDYKEFAQGAIAANERISAGQALSSRGLNIDPKDQEFLTNMSQMKGGEMQITIPQSLMEKFGKDFNNKSEVKLSELTDKQVEILKENRKKLEEMNPEDIAKGQFTAMKNSENYLQSISAEIVQGGKNKLVGRNEYTGKDDKERGAVNLEGVAQTWAKATDQQSKQILLGFENQIVTTLNNTISTLSAGLKNIVGDRFKPENVDRQLKNIYGMGGGDVKNLEAENRRLKEFYDKGNGKDQPIPHLVNFKFTTVGMPDGSTLENTSGRSFLLPTK